MTTFAFYKTENIDPKTNLYRDPTGPEYNYAPAVRSQADNLGDMMSAETALDTGSESDVRPEYGPEQDINNILKRHGVDLVERPIKYGEVVDYTLDLQKAMMATEAAANAHQTIPPELRTKYPTYKEWLNGINSGQYLADLQDLTEKKKAAAEREKLPAEDTEQEPEKPAGQKKETPKESPKE